MCIIAGIFAALWLTRRRWAARGGNPDDISDITLWAVPFGVIGGRLYHVITDPELYFTAGKEPIRALYIWDGGLGIPGAVALGAVGAWIGCRRHGIKLADYADALAPGLILAQAIGRWGNYFNQELYGDPTTLPWALHIDPANRPEATADIALYHPTFLYESLWNLAAVALLLFIDRRCQLRRGRLFACYVMAYTAGRFWIEGMRSDFANQFLGLRVNEWVSLVAFTGAAIFFWASRSRRFTPPDSGPSPAGMAEALGSDTVTEDTGRLSRQYATSAVSEVRVLYRGGATVMRATTMEPRPAGLGWPADHPEAEGTRVAEEDKLADAQQAHWQSTYSAHPGMYGEQPSSPAVHAAEAFRTAGAKDVLELGAGHGRDALYFAREGFAVQATDFSPVGLEQLQATARVQGVDERVSTRVHDVREPLPLPDASVDAVFAHMLLCMALSTSEIHTLVEEVRRVLRPGGVFVYTVRHVGDAHYGAGTAHGDDIYEHGGFAVHFFPRHLVGALAAAWILNEVHSFEEGDLPRRLWRVTQTRPL